MRRSDYLRLVAQENAERKCQYCRKQWIKHHEAGNYPKSQKWSKMYMDMQDKVFDIAYIKKF